MEQKNRAPFAASLLAFAFLLLAVLPAQAEDRPEVVSGDYIVLAPAFCPCETLVTETIDAQGLSHKTVNTGNWLQGGTPVLVLNATHTVTGKLMGFGLNADKTAVLPVQYQITAGGDVNLQPWDPPANANVPLVGTKYALAAGSVVNIRAGGIVHFGDSLGSDGFHIAATSFNPKPALIHLINTGGIGGQFICNEGSQFFPSCNPSQSVDVSPVTINVDTALGAAIAVEDPASHGFSAYQISFDAASPGYFYVNEAISNGRSDNVIVSGGLYGTIPANVTLLESQLLFSKNFRGSTFQGPGTAGSTVEDDYVQNGTVGTITIGVSGLQPPAWLTQILDQFDAAAQPGGSAGGGAGGSTGGGTGGTGGGGSGGGSGGGTGGGSAATQAVLAVTVKGNGLVSSSPGGIMCPGACTRAFPLNQSVTLTPSALAGGKFIGWSGACSGAGACIVPMSVASAVTANFAYTLTISGVSGGSVTSTPAGISCPSSCTMLVAPGQSVTLQATALQGYTFLGWSGGCAGFTTTCQFVMNGNTTVGAPFSSGQGFHVGAVYSTTQPASQSFLRFFNSSATAGAVGVTLSDAATGLRLGQWTSPSIAPNTAPQYSISDIEAGAGIITKPDFYSLTINQQFNGSFQHVLWHAADGTLTNLTTCDAGTGTDPFRLKNVHSSVLAAQGYPSTIVAHNSSASSSGVTLNFYDAATYKRLGSYYILLSANGEQSLPVADVEQYAKFTPGAVTQYIVTADGLTGYLQHLVYNTKAGVITDMSTVCSQPAPAASTPAALQESAVYSSRQTDTQSFLRFYNSGTTAGRVTVTLYDSSSGGTPTSGAFGIWTSPSIAPGTAPQFAIGDIDNAIATRSSRFTAKPDRYALAIRSGIAGTFQHVYWHVSDGSLTNASTCDAGTTIPRMRVANVHSSLFAANYPSTIVVYNTGAAAATALLTITDARTGLQLGSVSTASIPPNGQQIVTMASLQAGAHITADAGMYHLTVSLPSSFTGYLQHLVNNQQVGVVTDMTTICTLPAVSAATTYTLTTSTSGSGQGTIAPDMVALTADAPANVFGPYNPGTVVKLTATAKAGSTFTGWTGDCSGTAFTCTVTLAASKNVGAQFQSSSQITTYTVTYTATSPGSTILGQLSAYPVNPSSDDRCTEFAGSGVRTCVRTVLPGAQLSIIASPAYGAALSAWSGACSGTADLCKLTVASDLTVTATFNKASCCTLNTQIVGNTPGTLVFDPPGPVYAPGTKVTITPSSTLATWIGCGSDIGSSLKRTSLFGYLVCTVTMDTNHNFTAIFNASGTQPTYTLQVSNHYDKSIGRIGTVTSSPAGIQCDGSLTAVCAATFPAGTVVTLTETVLLGNFAGWNACDSPGSPGVLTCKVTMSTNKSVSNYINP